jgi:hypothetical protein
MRHLQMNAFTITWYYLYSLIASAWIILRPAAALATSRQHEDLFLEPVPDGFPQNDAHLPRTSVAQDHRGQFRLVALVDQGKNQLPGVLRPVDLVDLVEDEHRNLGVAGEYRVGPLTSAGLPAGPHLGQEVP